MFFPSMESPYALLDFAEILQSLKEARPTFL
jgi:hypothetical protein